MRSAWYKPFHEPSREQIDMEPVDALKAIDDHDLKQLAEFWRAEIKTMEGVAAIPGKAPQALPQDYALAAGKLARLNAEIRRRRPIDTL